MPLTNCFWLPLAFFSACSMTQRVLDDSVALRVHMPETLVLQFQANAVDAQPVGDGRVNFQGFPGDTPPLGRGQGIQGLHVVTAVGQLYQDDAYVLDHGQDHFSEAGGLGLFMTAEGQFVQLADAVHQVSNLAAKACGNLFLERRRVLDHIMQQGRLDRLGVQVQIGQYAGHGHRVSDIGLAGLSSLALVCLVGKIKGVDNALYLRFGEVGFQSGYESG